MEGGLAWGRREGRGGIGEKGEMGELDEARVGGE